MIGKIGSIAFVGCVLILGAWILAGETVQTVRVLPPTEPIVREAEPEPVPEPIAVEEKRPVVAAKPAPKPIPEPVAIKQASTPPKPLPVVADVPKPKEVASVPIVMQSVLAVRCKFSDGAGSAITAFGSGVAVTASGHVLTARHVVDMDYTFRITGGRQGRAGFQLDACEVGGPGEGARAPSVADIRAINPFTEVLSLPYRAELALAPGAKAGAGMSDAEADFLDIAILKITGPTADAEKFFGVTAPSSFPKSQIATDTLPGMDEELITFGFPSGTPAYGSSFRLQGSVGTVRQYVAGDLLFKNQPLGIEAEMETIGGRSGSPVFWKGRVVGIVSAKRDYSKEATIVSVYPLKELLKGSNIALDIP